MTPFSQFETIILVKEGFYGVDILLTNLGVYVILGILVYQLITKFSMKKILFLGGPWQKIVESFYIFLLDMVKEQVGFRASSMFPMIYTIFCIILLLNMLGIIPFSFAVTGQIIVTFLLSTTYFMAWILIGVMKQKTGFLKIFVPSGVTKELLPLLVVIEVLSFVIRPISLAIRLFANILAGHILLIIISAFVLVMLASSGVLGGMPWVALCAFYILEIGIAFLQAYVFSILLCIYLKDAFESH